MSSTSTSTSIHNKEVKKIRKLSREASNALREWFNSHLSCPYPSKEEKEVFVQTYKITPTQLENFFSNARRRYLPKGAPKVYRRYMNHIHHNIQPLNIPLKCNTVLPHITNLPFPSPSHVVTIEIRNQLLRTVDSITDLLVSKNQDSLTQKDFLLLPPVMLPVEPNLRLSTESYRFGVETPVRNNMSWKELILSHDDQEVSKQNE